MRITLKAKLGAIFAGVLALSGIGMYVAIDKLSELNEQFGNAVDGNVARIDLADDINVRTLRIARDEKNVILSNSVQDMNQIVEQMRREEATIKQQTDKLIELASADGRKRIDQFSSAWENYLTKHREVVRLALLNSSVEARRLLQGDGEKALNALLEGLRGAGQNYEQLRAEIAEARLANLNVITSADNPEDQQRYARIAEEKFGAVTRQIEGDSSLPASARQQWGDVLSVAARVRTLALENGNYRATVLAMGEAATARRAAAAAIESVVDLNNEQLQRAKTATAELYSDSRTLLLGILGVSLVISIAGISWILWSITRGVNSAVSLASAVASGNLNASATVSSNDEIRDLVNALNGMTAKLREIVGEVSSATRNVAAGSQELSAAAEELSQGATEQASSTEEASSSMEEIAANIKQNADNAGHVDNG
jgi:methyl-accepting chemotaxis protein